MVNSNSVRKYDLARQERVNKKMNLSFIRSIGWDMIAQQTKNSDYVIQTIESMLA